jgi:hypothetical protein
MNILWWLVFSIASACCYRMGGTSLGTKWRDCGVPLVATAYLLVLGLKAPWWAYLAHFGLLWAAMTTYWKAEDEDVKFWDWILTGFFYGFAALPMAWATGHWLGFGARCLILSALVTIWSEAIGTDWLEEGGRGFFTVATLPLLL